MLNSRALVAFALFLSLASTSQVRAAAFLFDATHAETAGNADWVIDADNNIPQRIPTPDQANITAATAETYWKGAISSWAIALVKRGHHVETLPSGTAITYQNVSNAQDLSNYKVFVVDEPNKSFTTAEKTAIVKFVRDGGSLFMVADHDGSDRNGDGKDSVVIWNDLFATNSIQAAPFGIVINATNISPSNESADSTATNPITHGAAGTITQFAYADGASMTIDLTKNPSVRGAVWTTSSHTNSNVMVAYGTFGAGKFVAIGDSSPADDGTGATGDTLFDGWNDAGGDNGDLIINASLWLAAAAAGAPPANDNFVGAVTLTGTTASVTGTNVNATKETGEPSHGGNAGGKSVWWKWTAPSSGDVVLDTNGSNFDTLLGVYTGTAVNALTQIAGDNNGGPSLTSRVAFTATAGVVYRIAVDGTGALSGNIQLNLTLTPPQMIGTDTLASWNFDTVPYPNPLAATMGSGSIDFTGWGGTITNFGGVTGQALALVGTEGNGTYFELAFSMSGHSGLNVAFATRGTATGYTSGLWSWSVNGGPFTTLPGVNTATTSTNFVDKTADFSSQTALNNAAAVRLRYTLDGSSGQSPNARIDDLVVRATRVPMVSVVVTDPDAYEKGGNSASVTVSSSLAAGVGGLPVQFQLSGTAMPPGAANADYALSGNSAAGTITIPAGATSATLLFVPASDSDPAEFDETATITLQPGVGYFVGAAGAASITIHDDTPYNSTWTAQFPGFSGANAAALFDIEKDGVSNFLEFAFNGDPFHSDNAILPVVGTMMFADPSDGNIIKPYPTITFRRRTDAPDLEYFVESSGSLTAWTNEVEQISNTPGPGPNVETVVYRGLTPLSGNGALTPRFLRVRVSADDN